MISYYSEQFKDSDTQVNVCLSYVMIEGLAKLPCNEKEGPTPSSLFRNDTSVLVVTFSLFFDMDIYLDRWSSRNWTLHGFNLLL